MDQASWPLSYEERVQNENGIKSIPVNGQHAVVEKSERDIGSINNHSNVHLDVGSDIQSVTTDIQSHTNTSYSPPSNSSTPAQTPRSSTPSVKPKRRKKSSLSLEGHSRSSSSVSAVLARETIPPRHPLNTFKNLIVMEESLRQQYIAMAISRKKHVLFFSFLVLSSTYFGYAMFINPSIYRLVNFFDQLMFMASIVILGLFYLTGLYTKAFVYSPRFIHNANKGLRPFNVKLVRVPRTWKEYLISVVWDPGFVCAHGRLVKIILSARAFSPEIVEGWEIYRNEYWERENTRQPRAKNVSVSRAEDSTNGLLPIARDRRPRRRTLSKPQGSVDNSM